jgi:hypothetical protein
MIFENAPIRSNSIWIAFKSSINITFCPVVQRGFSDNFFNSKIYDGIRTVYYSIVIGQRHVSYDHGNG